MGNGVEQWGTPIATSFAPPKYRSASESSSSSYLMTIDSDPTRMIPNKNQIILSFQSINIGLLDCSTDRLVVYDGDG
eukprot:13957170-Ditylum_brightwellii.AAC.1